jgi:hypothetical protein
MLENNIKMKMTVLWVLAPCNLVEIYRRFRGACCLHHQGYEVNITEYLYRLQNRVLIIYYYVLQGHYIFRSFERPSSGGTQYMIKI